MQRFLPGTLYGLSAHITAAGDVEIFEAHRQVVDEAGHCTGARWTAEIEATQITAARAIYCRLARVPSLTGLVCLDVIDGRVIEVNPRVTASAPIAHLLSLESQLRDHRGQSFHIRQLDVNTALPIPFDSIEDGRVWRLIQTVESTFGVIALPQGLNPFGASRMVFVNDDDSGTAQNFFSRQLGQWPATPSDPDATQP
ncbi:hypothetical protein [Cryobacterium sp. CG_9.6]|uniref:hypothetical protein n=1 Tax=Cryobacterium sp. CG_9.6 TaxID=2760710 RepID=UPI0024750919|nr:hypothetical protein [Cryobacterium sp. CG_9.6]MDH6236822.1 hypothetical protein [Cryobacterium sp. CG_9.6]